MVAVLDPLRVPLQALVVAMGGVGLSWLWFHDHRLTAGIAIVVVLLLGAAIDSFGNRCLPRYPVFARHLLEGWILIPLALAATAAAAIVVVTVELTVPDGTPTDTKELLGSASTGITAFLTAAFVSWASDDDASSLADHIKARFQGHYVRTQTQNDQHVFKEESTGERWVYSESYGGIDGWGRRARKVRAKGIKAELESKQSDPG